ncbi:MAG: alpha/beta hydrolase [Thermodesulfobacteriota bacterium]
MPILRHGGVGLFYELAGQGGVPLVFIHGMTCDHTFFAPQAAHFAARQPALSLDLRGHGQSDAPQQDYRIPAFAEEAAWLSQQLGLGPLVAVGHSLGGAVALEMAYRFPGLVRAAALLDTTVISSRQRTEKILPQMLKRLAQPDYRHAFADYFSGFFLPSDDPQIKRRVLDIMTSAPQHVMLSLFEALRLWDGARLLAQAPCPLLYVGAAQPLTALELLKEHRPDLHTGQVVGSGHFLTLQVPDQVNAMLERFLGLLSPA